MDNLHTYDAAEFLTYKWLSQEWLSGRGNIALGNHPGFFSFQTFANLFSYLVIFFFDLYLLRDAWENLFEIRTTRYLHRENYSDVLYPFSLRNYKFIAKQFRVGHITRIPFRNGDNTKAFLKH